MPARGLDPGALPSLQVTDDASFLRAHLYETHDVWHVVTGFDNEWQSEIGLQGFYLAQFPGALSAVLLGLGCLRVGIYDIASREPLMSAIVRGWVMGKRARPFFGVRWDRLWDKPLADVRSLLDVQIDAAAA